VIIVTGASKGIGKTICERLLSNNQAVIGLARDTSKLDFESYDWDVSSFKDIENTVRKIKKNSKSIQGLINAAGTASMNLALLTPSDISKKIIETNLLGTIYCCQLISPLMIREKNGVIINFSTIAVNLALKGESIYAASKAGVETFSKVLARELSSFNINVNCIAPGPIDTSLIKGVSKTEINNLISRQVIQKQFTKFDIADIVELLLNKKFKSISGEVLHIGGS